MNLWKAIGEIYRNIDESSKVLFSALGGKCLKISILTGEDFSSEVRNPHLRG